MSEFIIDLTMDSDDSNMPPYDANDVDNVEVSAKIRAPKDADFSSKMEVEGDESEEEVAPLASAAPILCVPIEAKPEPAARPGVLEGFRSSLGSTTNTTNSNSSSGAVSFTSLLETPKVEPKAEPKAETQAKAGGVKPKKGATKKHVRNECQTVLFNESDAALFCSSCTCYVCNVSASACKDWDRHCFATSNDPIWVAIKNEMAKRKKALTTTIAATVGTRFNISYVPLTPEAFRLMDLPPLEQGVRAATAPCATSYKAKQDAYDAANARKRQRAYMRMITHGRRGGCGRPGCPCGGDDDESDDSGSDLDVSDPETDDEILNTGGGSYTFDREIRRANPSGESTRYPQYSPYGAAPIPTFVTDTANPRMTRFLDNDIPRDVFFKGVVPRSDRKGMKAQLMWTFIDAILAKLLKSVDIPAHMIESKIPDPSLFIGRGGSDQSDRNYCLRFTMDSASVDLKDFGKSGTKFLYDLQERLGCCYIGDKIMKHEVEHKDKTRGKGVNVIIHVRKYFPSAQSIIQKSVYERTGLNPSASTRILENRVICPLCSAALPINYSSKKCKSCLLYMCTPEEIDMPSSDTVTQIHPQPNWVEIGQKIDFQVMIQPEFISKFRSTALARLPPTVCCEKDGYVIQQGANQVKCFRKEILGEHPDVKHLVGEVTGADGSTLRSAARAYACRLDLLENFTCDANNMSAVKCPEQAYFNTFLRACIDLQKDALKIVCSLEDDHSVLDEKRIPAYCRNFVFASAAKLTIRLYLVPTNLAHRGAAPWRNSFWGATKQILACFITPRRIPRDDGEKGAIIKRGPDVKPADLVVADDCLLEPSKKGGGGYSVQTTSLESMLVGILSEAFHNGMTPFGMALKDPYIYAIDKLGEKYNKAMKFTDPFYVQRRAFNTQLQENIQQRYLPTCSNLAELLVSMESLGHTAVTAASDLALRTELNVELRPYQKQSLRWALDQENREGGISAHLNGEIIGSQGQKTGVYYSPFTDIFSTDRGPDVRGGFICEEMGMGKTIITLGLIICNPPPADTTGPQAKDQWGDFSPDKDKERKSKEKTSRSVQMNDNGESYVVTTTTTDKYKHVMPEVKIRSRGTLVICPVSLVGQWCSEARSKLSGGSHMKIHEYHGQKRIRDPAKLAGFDLVVTTYETLSSDLRKFYDPTTSRGKKGASVYNKAHYMEAGGDYYPACHMVNWFRIVMDESHKSKGKSGVSDSLSSLYSKRRWCVTGTPMGNNVTDISGQFGALGVPILNDASYWGVLSRSGKYAHVMSGGDPGHAGVTSILRRTMVRHSKNMKYKGNQSNLLSLPPKIEHIQWIEFNEAESIKYRQVEIYNRLQYEFIARGGEQNVRRNTIRLLSLIKDLQMVCSGGYMPQRLATVLNRDPALLDVPPDQVEELDEEPDDGLARDGECSICLSLYETPVDTACGHRFCADCISNVISGTQYGKPECPLCRRAVALKDLKTPDGKAYGAKDAAVAKKKSGVVGDDGEPLAVPDILLKQTKAELDQGKVRSDTSMLSKLTWLVNKVQSILTGDNTSKILIFTQFNTTLEWLGDELPKLGLQYRTLTGSMSMAQRKASLESFQNDPPTTVFLLSMRAGAVGINLTQANHVIVLEPCLNKALEAQAIGRVHRMGQTREVHIWKVACLNSVEEKILKLQEQKESGQGTTAYEPTAYGGTPKVKAVTPTATITPATTDGLVALPMMFDDIAVDSSISAAYAKHNLLSAGPTGWRPSAATIPVKGMLTVKIKPRVRTEYNLRSVFFQCTPARTPSKLDIYVTCTDKDGSESRTCVTSEGSIDISYKADNKYQHSLLTGAQIDTIVEENGAIKSMDFEFSGGSKTGDGTEDSALPFEITEIRLRGKKASAPISPVAMPTAVGMAAEAMFTPGMGSSKASAQPQQVSGSITSDKATVNSKNFEVLFGISQLPEELLATTKTPETIFHYDENVKPSVFRPIVPAAAPAAARGVITPTNVSRFRSIDTAGVASSSSSSSSADRAASRRSSNSPSGADILNSLLPEPALANRPTRGSGKRKRYEESQDSQEFAAMRDEEEEEEEEEEVGEEEEEEEDMAYVLKAATKARPKAKREPKKQKK